MTATTNPAAAGHHLTVFRPFRPGHTPNSIHRIVAAATNGAPHLWRQNRDGSVIILSDAPLDGDVGVGDWKPSKLYQPRFEVGKRVRFQVRLNPVRNAPRNGAERSRKVPVHSGDIPGWVFNLLDGAGLNVSELQVVSSGQGKFDHRTGVVPQTWVDVEGAAVVADPGRVLSAVRSGVGRNRRFGCGMLQLIPD